MFNRLQKLQNRAARVLTFSRCDAYANRLFKQLNWKDLSTQFQVQKALMVHKSLNDLVPGYLSSKLLNDVKPTSSPGLFPYKMGGAGKGPGIGWSRVPSYTLKSWV